MNRLRQTLLPLLAACIWGTAFAAQSIGAEYLRPFTFNAARSIVAFLFLLSVCLIRDRIRTGSAGTFFHRDNWRELLTAGISCGLILGCATFFQQRGLDTTSPGKAGFLTALYIVIVPLLGIVMGRRTAGRVWFSVGLAVAGLYFLCVREGFSIAPGDADMLICALCFSVQILTIDYFSLRLDGLELSCIQFLTMSVFSLCGMVLSGETVTFTALQAAVWAILYCGIFSSGVAYTIQIIAQRNANPAVISLLLSTESVFAVIAGAVVLHERLNGREAVGCALMFAAVICAQIPRRKNAPVDSPV